MKQLKSFINYFEVRRDRIGLHLLRLGMSAVFLWFGFSQLFDSLKWVSVVPSWIVDFLNISPAIIVVGNGLFEVILGTLLAMGFLVRLISLVLGLHLLPIAFSFGVSAIGVRDFGLAIASFSLFFLYSHKTTPKINITSTM